MDRLGSTMATPTGAERRPPSAESPAAAALHRRCSAKPRSTPAEAAYVRHGPWRAAGPERTAKAVTEIVVRRRAAASCSSVRALLDGVIVGQQALVNDLVTAVFAGGHVLLEGLPGLGKTHLAKALAAALGLQWARVQCTPDLMPADVTGAEIYATAAGGASSFVFRPGPVFAQLLLVDEINRATPRTQAALLEAMQEMQVTHAGATLSAAEPVLRAGDAEPDRARGHLPAAGGAARPLHVQAQGAVPGARIAARAARRVAGRANPPTRSRPIAGPADVLRIAALCRTVLLAERCKQAAVSLVLATQPDAGGTRFGRAPAHALRRQPARAAGAGARRARARSDGRPRARRHRRPRGRGRCRCCATASCCGSRASSTDSMRTRCSRRCSANGAPDLNARRAARQPELQSFARAAAHLLAERQPRAPGTRDGEAQGRRRHPASRPPRLRCPATKCATSTGARLRGGGGRSCAGSSRNPSSDWCIVLDASSSMAVNGAAKWQAAVRGAAAMSYALLELGHRVGLLAFGRARARRVSARPRAAPTTPRSCACLRALRPARAGELCDLGACARRLRGAASVVVFSDFLADDEMRRDSPRCSSAAPRCTRCRSATRAETRVAVAGEADLVDVETGERIAARRRVAAALAASSAPE